MTVPWLVEENCECEANTECTDQQAVCNSSPSYIFIIEKSEENVAPEFLNLHSCTEIVFQSLAGNLGIIHEKCETLKRQPSAESAILICYKYKKSCNGFEQRSVFYELVGIVCVIICNCDGKQGCEKVASLPVIKTSGKHRKSMLKSSFYGTTNIWDAQHDIQATDQQNLHD